MKLLIAILILFSTSAYSQITTTQFKKYVDSVNNILASMKGQTTTVKNQVTAIDTRTTSLETRVTSAEKRIANTENWQSNFDATSIPFDSLTAKANKRIDSLVTGNKITDDAQDSKMRQLQDLLLVISTRLDSNSKADKGLNAAVSNLNNKTNARIDSAALAFTDAVNNLAILKKSVAQISTDFYGGVQNNNSSIQLLNDKIDALYKKILSVAQLLTQ